MHMYMVIVKLLYIHVKEKSTDIVILYFQIEMEIYTVCARVPHSNHFSFCQRRELKQISICIQRP